MSTLSEDQKTHWILTLMALYVSEAWYAAWVLRSKPHHRARAVVYFDRALNQDLDRMEKHFET